MIEEISRIDKCSSFDIMWIYYQNEEYRLGLAYHRRIMTFDEVAKQLGIRARIIKTVDPREPNPIVFFDMLDYFRFV